MDETPSTPPWLRTATDEQLGDRPRPLPSWLVPDRLPPVRVGGYILDAREIHAVLNALRDGTPARPAPLVGLLRQHADADSLDTFARALGRAWIDADEPAGHRWALEAMGALGGDAAALELAGLIRAWALGKRHRRALEALELLRQMGGDAALVELTRLAQAGRPRRLQQTAAGLLATVATERGLTTDQLHDRTVPTLGLDAAGGRLLTFGGRSFSVVIDATLEPLLRDPGGQLRPALPRPARGDDPAAVAAAREKWKLLSKQLRSILQTQASRLEGAMIAGRRWSAGEFVRFLVRHPVLGLLTRRLLWATDDRNGGLARPFRVTDDGTFVDVEESAVEVAPSTAVRLVHPLHLDETSRRAWQQVFTDHELVPPFPQLARSVYTPLPAEQPATAIERLRGFRVQALTLVGLLDRLGWDRGLASPRQATSAYGITPLHVKYFPGADLLAVLRHDPGVPTRGFFREWEDQTLGDCFFVRGLTEPPGGFHPEQGVPLAEVDPVVLSEVLGVLELLRARAISGGASPRV